MGKDMESVGRPHSHMLPQLPHNGLHSRALLHWVQHCLLEYVCGPGVCLYTGMAALLSQTVQGPPAHVQTLWHGYCIHSQVLTAQLKLVGMKELVPAVAIQVAYYNSNQTETKFKIFHVTLIYVTKV